MSTIVKAGTGHVVGETYASHGGWHTTYEVISGNEDGSVTILTDKGEERTHRTRLDLDSARPWNLDHPASQYCARNPRCLDRWNKAQLVRDPNTIVCEWNCMCMVTRGAVPCWVRERARQQVTEEGGDWKSVGEQSGTWLARLRPRLRTMEFRFKRF